MIDKAVKLSLEMYSSHTQIFANDCEQFFLRMYFLYFSQYSQVIYHKKAHSQESDYINYFIVW